MQLRSLPTLGTCLVLVLAPGACEPAQETEPEAEEVAAEPGVIEITAKDFEFEAPDQIPSGWTTVVLENVGEQEHFAYLYRIPDTVTYADYKQQVSDVFIRLWNRYDAGELDRQGFMENLAAEVPEWALTGGIVPSGGPALTEAGETSQATVRLDPGTYVIECYVKTPQNTWHTERGMIRELTVTAESNGAQPPGEVDAELTLSNYQIATSGELTAGERTIAVHVEENPEGFNMHDVNLVRLDGDATAEEVVAWMDWMDLEQFRAPAPGYSLGGMDQMVAGRTGYMTVNLTPGTYVWVSEGYGGRGMVEEFTVE